MRLSPHPQLPVRPPFPRTARRRASVTVEFALVLSLALVPFLFGFLDWSWYLFQAMTVQSMFHQAVRTGAAVDLAEGTCPGDKAYDTLTDSFSIWNLSGADIHWTTQVYSFGVGGTSNIQEMTFTVSVPYTPIFQPDSLFLPSAMGGTLTVPLEDQTNDIATYGCS